MSGKRLIIHTGGAYHARGAHADAGIEALTGRPVEKDLPRSAYLGTVAVTGVHHASECMDTTGGAARLCFLWAEPDCWHICLTDPKPFAEPKPGAGRLSFWTPEDQDGIALSVRQPYADAIMRRGKDVENRAWKYRPGAPITETEN